MHSHFYYFKNNYAKNKIAQRELEVAFHVLEKCKFAIRPLTGEINISAIFFVKEEIVDLLFEAMTYSAVKSSLINGRAMLRT